jgi:hypothetical protein
MLVGEGHDWDEGEERAWDTLAGLDPEDVTQRARAVYDSSLGGYVLPLFNRELSVRPGDRQISGNSSEADLLLNRLSDYATLSVLWYLIQAKNVPLSGNLVNPSHTGEARMFFAGAHALPLHRVVRRYGNDARGFLRKGFELGGEQLDFGDASLRLFPFPRVPAVLVLWTRDEEFPARADLLFDSTCSIHLPMDILWATAMMSVVVML